MNRSGDLGREGEDLACEYLKKKGFKVLERNVKFKFGEIDVIARDRSGVLVFVEVKVLQSGELIPEDHMTVSKIKKFRRAAEFYTNANPEILGSGRVRLDLVAIEVGERRELRHYEGVC